MKIRTSLRNSLVMGSLLFLAACGGGGGGSTAPNTVVKGVAQAGVFSSATVKIFGYNAAGDLVQLPTTPATVTTDSNGIYQADIGSYTGAVVVKLHGTFRDEASGTDITVPEADPLQAAVAGAAGTVTVPVTPLTDLAVRKALKAGSIKDNIANSNQAISTLFGFDIIATAPVAPTAIALQNAAVTDNQKKYTTTLAALSQYVVNFSSTPAAPTATDLENALNQISVGITLSGATAQVTSPQVALSLQESASELAVNPKMQGVVTAAGTAAQTTLSGLGTVGNTAGNKILAVRLKTVGSYTGVVIATTANVTLPGLATLRVDPANGATLEGAVVASGNAVGTTVSGGVHSGVLTVSVASNALNGFGVGEFATIYCDVPATSTLTAADFTAVTNVTTKDVNGATISGITTSAF